MKTSTEVKKQQASVEETGQTAVRRGDLREGGSIAPSPATPDSEQSRISLELLDDNPDQPRQYIDTDYVDGLANTIQQCGLIHRIVVRRQGERFQIVAGHCRRDAYKRLRARGVPGEWTTIPADVVRISDEQAALHCLLENIEREDLSPAEEGAAYAGLMDKYRLATVKELAAKLGVDEQRVSRRLRINEGPDCIKRALTRGLKVPLPDPDEGSRKKNETRRLTLHGALEFLRLHEHRLRKYPGTKGGRPDGQPIADIKTELVVMRSLSEGWSRQRVNSQVDRLLRGKTSTTVKSENTSAPPLFEIRSNRFVVFTQRAAKAPAAEREALVAELRRALIVATAQT